jgi:phage terminase large subunit GpA-like protein
VLQQLLLRVASEWEPREPIPTAEFAEDHLRLPQEVAEAHGRFDLYYAPHLRGIFAAMDDPQVQEIDCMKGAQVAWTTALIAYLANRICTAPCAMIGLFDSDGAARDFHDEKLVPIVSATPELSRRINIKQTRTAGNRADFKRFPGGFLKLGGSGQIRKLKSTSAGVLFVEEPDDAKDNVRDQGDAIQLLWERAKRRKRVKRILGGTPSLKGFSQVEFRLELSDKRVLPIACHDCGEKHVMDLDNVSWHDHDGPAHPVYGRAVLDSAVYVCPHCGSAWDDHQRHENIRATVQAAVLACDPYYGWTPTRPFNGIAGFHELNEAYSCLPGVGMTEFVRDKLEAEHAAAQGDQNRLIVFVNSKYGRPYEFSGEHARKDDLRAAALDYPEGTVPAGGLILTAGVDVQHNRLSVLIRAHGRDRQSWLTLWTEPAAVVAVSNIGDAVWLEAEKILFGTEYFSADGLSLRVSALTIDSSDGQTNDAVYAWVTAMRRKYPAVAIMAGKGASSGEPEIFTLPSPKAVDPKRADKASKADRWGLRVHLVGTAKAKDYLSERWRLEANGAGHQHAYAGVREDYWEQITAEIKAPNRSLRGKRVWTKKVGHPNEALDCEVYAEHAARAIKVHIRTVAQWDSLDVFSRQGRLFDSVPETAPFQVDSVPDTAPFQDPPADSPPPVPPRGGPRPRGGRGWVDGWK